MRTAARILGMGLAAAALSGCALLGWGEKTTLRIHEEVPAVLPESRAMPVTLEAVNLQLTVDPRPVLSEKDVKSAELYPTAGGFALQLRFSKHGLFVLDEVTTRLRGRRLVTFLDGKPVAVWLVNQRVSNGQLLVEGDFTDDEARRAVDYLNRLGQKHE